MLSNLENLLYEKTKGTQSSILFAQWKYDREALPLALQSVAHIFPHYSLHDESHSITIINNIIRIIGWEGIKQLPAIDIWLILEAAYSHDLGMVVPGDQISKEINADDFKDFFHEILSNERHSLHEFANVFEISDNKIQIKNAQFSFEIIDGFKFILAEFYRRIHADRSHKIVVDPTNEISLASPRIVIPPRLFGILGKICSAHTKDFTDVMRLPHSEVGIDVEDAHPRFIACLLRIGDLLDLDNNRFSEVMLRTLARVPIETIYHKSKHLSIDHLRIDTNQIEVNAKCVDYKTANLTQHWFNYINSEINAQTINWNQIVPFSGINSLPIIKSLTVELTTYDLIDGIKNPKFQVDTEKALELLKGAGIYTSPIQSIRELLQNAVDATLLRIWLECEDKSQLAVPQSEYFCSVANNLSIDISIVEGDVIDAYKEWTITIRDKGIGISADDLKFLLHTGSSNKNKSRSKLIRTMHHWMRPSGTFGIGFQSIFMLTDRVKIKSKSYFDEKNRLIELTNPTSKLAGDVLLKTLNTSHSDKPGASLSFTYRTPAVPKKYTVDFSSTTALRIAHNYDPFFHKSFDLEIGKLRDEIKRFAQKSYLPITLKINDSYSKLSKTRQDSRRFHYYDEISAMEVSIDFPKEHMGSQLITYYKNQLVQNRIKIHFLNLQVNIHKDVASDVLELSRNNIREEYAEKLEEQIIDSCCRLVIKYFDDIGNTPEKKSILSMFLNLYSNMYSDNLFWQDLKINVNSNDKISLRDIIETTNKLTISLNNKHGSNPVFEYIDNHFLIRTHSSYSINGLSKFILAQFSKRRKFSFSKRNKNESGLTEFVYDNSKEIQVIPWVDFIGLLQDLLKGQYPSARCILPCPEGFEALSITPHSFENYVYEYGLQRLVDTSPLRILAPWVLFEDDDCRRELCDSVPQGLYDWVYNNRLDKNVTYEQIQELYAK